MQEKSFVQIFVDTLNIIFYFCLDENTFPGNRFSASLNTQKKLLYVCRQKKVFPSISEERNDSKIKSLTNSLPFSLSCINKMLTRCNQTETFLLIEKTNRHCLSILSSRICHRKRIQLLYVFI